MKINTIELKDEDILRYLAYGNEELEDSFISLLNTCKEEALRNINPKYSFSYNKIIINEKGVIVEGTNYILKGKAIKNHLIDCEECIFLGVTLGNYIEKLIRLYEKVDLTKALILDACATVAVEKFCDNFEEAIKNEMEILNKKITTRFSPGYGDFDLEFQKSLLNIINGEKAIGLTSSEHSVLMPRKSVTAIIGITSKAIKNVKRNCRNCNNYNGCNFKGKGSE